MLLRGAIAICGYEHGGPENMSSVFLEGARFDGRRVGHLDTRDTRAAGA